MTQKFDTLYARDGKGKVIEWRIEVQNVGGQINIKKAYGEFGGGMTIRWQKNIKGTNIGKSNETTPWEQAISNAESNITRQKQKGYMTLEQARALSPLPVSGLLERLQLLTDDNRNPLLTELESLLPKFRMDASGDIKPMKANQYYRSKKNWLAPDGVLWEDRKYYYMKNPFKKKEKGAVITAFPCIAQPKINGIRCTVQIKDNQATLKSKEGLEYIVPQINDFFNINNDIFVYNGEDIILDGELYIHGELLQDIRSAIVKANLNTPRVVFVLFDLAIEDVSNIDRWNIIKNHIKPKLDQHLNCPIQIIKTTKVTSDEEAQLLTDMFISQGYEGTIFRSFEDEYYFGLRKNNMTKLKRCISKEFKIIDIIPQEKDFTKGNYYCVTAKGEPFAVTPFGNDEFKRDLLSEKHSYKGKNLTVDFYEYTKDGKPFHIIYNIVRDYE